MSSLLIWSVVAATAAAWTMRLGSQSQPVPAHATTASTAAAVGGDLSRLFGQPPAAPVAAAPVAAAVPADDRFKLLGVVAPRVGTTTGLALISVDGKPARAVGLGREVEPGVRVIKVSHRQVDLGPGGTEPATVSLTLQALPEPNRGRPDQAGSPMAGGVADSVMPAPGMAGPAPGAPGLPPAGAAFRGARPGGIPMPMARPSVDPMNGQIQQQPVMQQMPVQAAPELGEAPVPNDAGQQSPNNLR